MCVCVSVCVCVFVCFGLCLCTSFQNNIYNFSRKYIYIYKLEINLSIDLHRNNSTEGYNDSYGYSFLL